MPDGDNNATSVPATPTNTPINTPTDVPTDTPTDAPIDTPAMPAVLSDAPQPSDPSVADDAATPPAKELDDTDVVHEVANKISEAHNILIALSSDPSVDEMAAAIGLSLFLDRLGKRATAIYSGSTPNALEFLKPEETFEPTADTLQDFVVALNKDKADHLRYKLDGDFVKIYITPYRTRISEEDLDFSYGDFNVDLVLALDVANGIDLDSALREHGRIMHDAVIVNITTGNPGKLGEIEWSDKTASSISEMIAKLLYNINGKVKIEKEEATAFLTGIVAATNRFSSASTTPITMKIASRLMESGANQQLVSKNITPDTENEMFSMMEPSPEKHDEDPTKLDIEHGNEEGVDETKEVDATVTEKESTLLDDLKAAEASLSQAGTETTPESETKPLKIDSDDADTTISEPTSPDTSETDNPAITTGEPTLGSAFQMPEVVSPVSEPTTESATEPTVEPITETVNQPASESLSEPTIEPTATSTSEPATESIQNDFISNQPEKVIQVPSDISSELSSVDNGNKYGQMLEDALASVEPPSIPAPQPITTPDTFGSGNPAALSSPAVPTNPEINGVPEINYMPMPGEEVLPPPPAPPIDMGNFGNAPAAPIAPTAPVEPAPFGFSPSTPQNQSAQSPDLQPQVSDPGAFKIPGM